MPQRVNIVASIACVFRGRAVVGPKSSRSAVRNDAGHRFGFQAGHFLPVVGILTGILRKDFHGGEEGRWTTLGQFGFLRSREETTLPTERLSMRKLREVLRLPDTSGHV